MEKALMEHQMQVHPIKVLIADDDAPTRILLRAAISQWGYEVEEAADGEEAWHLIAQSDSPKIVILDWLMPKLDGVKICQRVKNELTHAPYIIMLSQLSGTTNIVKGLEAGANEFLSKPFNMAELKSRLLVGKRIIQYQKSLAFYYHAMQELSGYLKNHAHSIEEFIACGSEKDDKIQMELMKDLQKEMKHIMQKMEEMHNKNKVLDRDNL